jgi:hypothetical protein
MKAERKVSLATPTQHQRTFRVFVPTMHNSYVVQAEALAEFIVGFGLATAQEAPPGLLDQLLPEVGFGFYLCSLVALLNVREQRHLPAIFSPQSARRAFSMISSRDSIFFHMSTGRWVQRG